MYKTERIIKLEASKSILNRILLISTMMEQPLEFSRISSCSDIKTMLTNLEKLGYSCQKTGNHFQIGLAKPVSGKVDLFIQDSGTALRFLLVRLACWEGIDSLIDISEQLRRRPIQPLLDSLNQLGAEIDASGYPIKIKGRRLTGGEITVRADVSSQFISALLLSAPLLARGLNLQLEGAPVSASYLELTLKIMQEFGIESERKENRISIAAGQRYCREGIYPVEPDFSSACYFWAMGALSSDWICTENMEGKSGQPDKEFLTILSSMGAEVDADSKSVCVRKKDLHGITVDMNSLPDQVLTLAVLTVFADSPTRISGIDHLRFKESDRISALQEELTKLGVKSNFQKGELIIYPTRKIINDVVLSSHNDHRIAMALHILRFVNPKIIISQTACITKSYPKFPNDFQSILV